MNPVPTPPLGPNEYVTWVRVEKSTFDIVGVLITSLGFTGLCVAIAAFLGVVLGAARIIRTRREHEMAAGRVSLQAAEGDPPPA